MTTPLPGPRVEDEAERQLKVLLSAIHVDLEGEPTYAETYGLRVAAEVAELIVHGLRDNAKCACDYDSPGPCDAHKRKERAAERRGMERAAAAMCSACARGDEHPITGGVCWAEKIRALVEAER